MKTSSSRLASDDDLLLAVAHRGQGGQGRVELPLAPVDEQDVGGVFALRNVLETPQHGFVDAGHVVGPRHAANLHPLVTRLERQTVEKLHHARHGFRAGDVGDVDALDGARPRPGAAPSANRPAPLGIDREDFRLHVLFQLSRSSSDSSISISSRNRAASSNCSSLAAAAISSRISAEQRFLAVEEALQAVNVLAVFLPGNPQVAGGRALADRGQQARAEPAPRLSLSSMSSVQVRNLKISAAPGSLLAARAGW